MIRSAGNGVGKGFIGFVLSLYRGGGVIVIVYGMLLGMVRVVTCTGSAEIDTIPLHRSRCCRT